MEHYYYLHITTGLFHWSVGRSVGRSCGQSVDRSIVLVKPIYTKILFCLFNAATLSTGIITIV